jgi:hypothetical protein
MKNSKTNGAERKEANAKTIKRSIFTKAHRKRKNSKKLLPKLKMHILRQFLGKIWIVI